MSSLQSRASPSCSFLFLPLLSHNISVLTLSSPFLHPLRSEPLKSQVRAAFADSIGDIWLVMVGVAGLGLIAAPFIKSLPLVNQVDENWGLREERGGEDVGNEKAEV